MDRNIPFDVIRPAIDVVALRKESVDRNSPAGCWRESRRVVALRKESVDRNLSTAFCNCWLRSSLSARRAWIEILLVYLALIRYLSLSARRAWIEMCCGWLEVIY